MLSLASHAIRPSRRRFAQEVGKWSNILSTSNQQPPTTSLAATQYRWATIASFKDLTFAHGNNNLLENVDFSIEAGSKVTIMGQNGSGVRNWGILCSYLMSTLYAFHSFHYHHLLYSLL